MNQIAHSTTDSASLRANRAQKKHGARALGMTLIEVLIGLAITTLMTVAGWRAIDALQSAREQTYRDANQWQTLDTLFTTIESDMRRADFSRFSGATESFTLRLNPLGASDIADTVRYVGQVVGENRIQIVRQATSGGVVMAEVDALRFSYRKASRANEPAAGSESSISEYPRAIEIALIIPGGDPESRRSITRTLVLR